MPELRRFLTRHETPCFQVIFQPLGICKLRQLTQPKLTSPLSWKMSVVSERRALLPDIYPNLHVLHNIISDSVTYVFLSRPMRTSLVPILIAMYLMPVFLPV